MPLLLIFNVASRLNLWTFYQLFSSVQSLSLVQLFMIPWPAAHQASLSFTNSWWVEQAQTMSIKSVMPSNHLILCCPLLLLPSIFLGIRGFFNESVCIRWPKYWSFTFSICPSNENSGLISFRIDWFDLLAVQGTLKSLQHHSSKVSILRRSALFMVQLWHPFMTTGKTIALTIWTFVSKFQWRCQISMEILKKRCTSKTLGSTSLSYDNVHALTSRWPHDCW